MQAGSKKRGVKNEFGYCVPFFAGAGDAHSRTPLLERMDAGHLERAIGEAEEVGYGSLWAADHLMLGRGSFVMEGRTVLSWACGLTRRVRLGTIHLSRGSGRRPDLPPLGEGREGRVAKSMTMEAATDVATRVRKTQR